jgi:N-acetylmuramoyl-L-alanine amidase
VTYHPRSDWVDPAYPVTGPAADWSKIDTAVIHYTAAANVPDGDRPDEVATYLRAIQRDYVTNRGYSIGYLFAVDQHGHQWQLRGWEFRSAANTGHNEHTLPILVLVDGSAPASPLAVEAVRQLIAEGQRRSYRAYAIVGHGQIGSTACPGIGLQAQVAAGVFTPVVEPDPVPPPTEDDDAMIALDWKPGTPSWTAFTWTGTHLAWVFDGNADDVLNMAGARRLTVSDAQLLGVIKSSQTTTPVPHTLPANMAEAWVA